jgi:hypothetical protein
MEGRGSEEGEGLEPCCASVSAVVEGSGGVRVWAFCCAALEPAGSIFGGCFALRLSETPPHEAGDPEPFRGPPFPSLARALAALQPGRGAGGAAAPSARDGHPPAARGAAAAQPPNAAAEAAQRGDAGSLAKAPSGSSAGWAVAVPAAQAKPAKDALKAAGLLDTARRALVEGAAAAAAAPAASAEQDREPGTSSADAGTEGAGAADGGGGPSSQRVILPLVEGAGPRLAAALSRPGILPGSAEGLGSADGGGLEGGRGEGAALERLVAALAAAGAQVVRAALPAAARAAAAASPAARLRAAVLELLRVGPRCCGGNAGCSSLHGLQQRQLMRLPVEASCAAPRVVAPLHSRPMRKCTVAAARCPMPRRAAAAAARRAAGAAGRPSLSLGAPGRPGPAAARLPHKPALARRPGWSSSSSRLCQP